VSSKPHYQLNFNISKVAYYRTVALVVYVCINFTSRYKLAEIDRRRRFFACIGIYELLFSVWELSRISRSNRPGRDMVAFGSKQEKVQFWVQVYS